MDDDWFFAENGNAVGPLKLDAVAAKVRLAPSLLVWKNGMEAWCEARLRPEFAGVLPDTPPPVPPPLPPAIGKWPSMRPPESSPSPATSLSAATESVYPWRRYFARTIDIFIFAAVLGIVLIFVSPDVLSTGGKTSDQVFGIISMFLYIPVDALILLATGASIGKLLYGIHVTRPEGFGFLQSIKRSSYVWLAGLGAGVPLISLFTLITAYRKLEKERTTSWDASTGCVVTYSSLSVGRWVAIAVVWAMAVALIVLGSTSS